MLKFVSTIPFNYTLIPIYNIYTSCMCNYPISIRNTVSKAILHANIIIIFTFCQKSTIIIYCTHIAYVYYISVEHNIFDNLDFLGNCKRVYRIENLRMCAYQVVCGIHNLHTPTIKFNLWFKFDNNFYRKLKIMSLSKFLYGRYSMKLLLVEFRNF